MLPAQIRNWALYGNRHYRRKAARLMKIPLDSHPARMQPLNLGIKKYKKEHVDEPKRVRYYKEEMWKAFHELKGVESDGSKNLKKEENGRK